MDQKSTKLDKTHHIAEELVEGVFELNILTNDYILHREQRSREQWWIRYYSIARLLMAGGRLKDRKVKVIIGKLRESHLDS